MTEEGDWSLQSEDEEQLRVEYDSDEFADESNVDDEDSSSQEYLHDENPPFLQDEFRNSSRQKKYTTGTSTFNYWNITSPTNLTEFFSDGRVCDYVVDGLESRMAATTGHCYATPGSNTMGNQSSAHRPNNLVSTVCSSEYFDIEWYIRSMAFSKIKVVYAAKRVLLQESLQVYFFLVTV